jgi:glycosyltransferase involved in cell wall biosynthesis
MRPSAPPVVSIIMPCRNDAAALGRTLDWLPRLVGLEEAEVIVTASGDADGTMRAAAERARVLCPGHSTRAALMIIES